MFIQMKGKRSFEKNTTGYAVSFYSQFMGMFFIWFIEVFQGAFSTVICIYV